MRIRRAPPLQNHLLAVLPLTVVVSHAILRAACAAHRLGAAIITIYLYRYIYMYIYIYLYLSLSLFLSLSLSLSVYIYTYIYIFEYDTVRRDAWLDKTPCAQRRHVQDTVIQDETRRAPRATALVTISCGCRSGCGHRLSRCVL